MLSSMKDSLHLFQQFIYRPFVSYGKISENDTYKQPDGHVWLKVDTEIRQIRGVDHRFWWETSGYALAIFLQNAHYPVEAQYQALVFFARIIATNMGIARDGRNPSWFSFMTDDGNPIELSWDWGTGNEAPKIRYSIEPLGLETGATLDCGNQQAEFNFRQQLLSALPTTRLEWFDHFRESFNYVNLDEDIALEGHRSRVFYAFDLNETEIKSKAYFFPAFKARAEGLPNWIAILRAIENAPHCTLEKLQALSVFREYASEPYHKGLELEMLAIDLVDPLTSRLKIYFRSRKTSFASVVDTMTLGGRIRSRELDGGIADLGRLWNAVLDAEISPNEPLPHMSHRTAGILYYVEFKLGEVLPSMKIYIPVRHYSISDQTVIQGLDNYLREHSRDKYMAMYAKSMSSLFTNNVVRTSSGLQTYIGCSICNDGGLRIVSYLNPRPLDIASRRRKTT